VEACAQEPVKRGDIDGPMLAEFQRRHLDLDATRERVAERMAADLTTAADLREQAETALGRTRAELDRVERDYLSGELSAANYERLGARLGSELQAAEAEVERRQEHERALSDARPLLDAEAETLRLLSKMRAAVLGEVGAASDVLALRRLLAQLFERVEYVPAGFDHPIMRIPECRKWPFPRAGKASLIPFLRDGVIEGYTPRTARPVVRRLTLPLETDGVGLPTHYLFTPIPVGWGKERGAAS